MFTHLDSIAILNRPTVRFLAYRWLTALVAWIVVVSELCAASPETRRAGLSLKLVAEAPAIVTPIGITFIDARNLLVVESHTHKRADDYEGPESDRIRRLSDVDGDGVWDRWTTYADGFQFAMNVVRDEKGGVYVVTRGAVHYLRDEDGDGRAEHNEVIVRLVTDDDYPHNALSSLVLAGGGFYLGLGENHGAEYRLVGSDGNQWHDHGGAGTIFYFQADGSGLERIATGLWNPFAMCISRQGLFAVDNDPHARPPCRLLHIRAGADFGFRYQYNPAGVHPLQAWDGELPGTVPMVCGTGEAPSGIVAARGSLWVTSWGYHRVERYELSPHGKSFTSERQIVVQGNNHFRPTGLALASDGSLYFTDWVKRNYPVHGAGRIWRLAFDTPENSSPVDPAAFELGATDVWKLSQRADLSQLDWQSISDPAQKLESLQALRWQRNEDTSAVLRAAISDADADVRMYAVRWICDERLTEFREDLARLLEGPMPDGQTYLRLLSGLDWLSRDDESTTHEISDGLLARELRNTHRSPSVQALALRMISPDYRDVTVERLTEFLQSDHDALRVEALRTLAAQATTESVAPLAELAADREEVSAIRAEAVTGLASQPATYRELLESLTADKDAVVAREAQRQRRLLAGGPVGDPIPPATDLSAWHPLVAGEGDRESGRRLFFSPVGARCSVCHQYNGRGGKIGPDLSRLSAQSSREKIVESILQPRLEVAPRYQPWVLVTDDGRSFTGLRVPQGGDNGQERYYNANGDLFELASDTIEERRASEVSLMPAGLEKILTVDDLHDLVTFLTTPETSDGL